MKFFYEKFWVPVFGYILSKFDFLIDGKKQDTKNKKKKINIRKLFKFFHFSHLIKSILFGCSFIYLLNSIASVLASKASKA